MFPPHAATRAVTPSSTAASMSVASTVTRSRSPSPSISASRNAPAATSTPVPATASRNEASTSLDAAAASATSTQSRSRPCTRTCSTSSTPTPCAARVPKTRAAMPGPSWPVTVRRNGSGVAALTAAVSHSRRDDVPLVDPARPLDPAAHDARRHTGDHAAVRHRPADYGAGSNDDVLADLGPREDDGVGPEPASRADVDGLLGRPLAPDGLDGVLVVVVLVGDVDVRARLDVVADHDLPVAHDVRAAADEAAAADRHHRVGHHLLAGGHPGGQRHARADDRLLPDVDQVLVEDGALGEEDAGAPAHATEAAASLVVRPDRTEVAGRLPGGAYGTRTRPAQRCGEGTGPAHAGMVGGPVRWR